MPKNIPVIKIGNEDYYVKDADARDQIDELKSALNKNTFVQSDTISEVQDSEIESGGWSYTQKYENNKRLRVSTLKQVRKNDIVQISNPTLEVFLAFFKRDSDSSYTDHSGWILADGVNTSYISKIDGYIAITFEAHDDRVLTTDDYDCAIRIVRPLKEIIDKQDSIIFSTNYQNDAFIVEKYMMESGGWIYSEKAQNITRIRSRKYIYVEKGHAIKIQAESNLVTIALMDNLSDQVWNVINIAPNDAHYQVFNEAKYICILESLPNYSEITVDDFNGIIQIAKKPGLISGKNVSIYRFGGAGNDWCFVRTPNNYDPYRKTPYPFVICNHGNGWVMWNSITVANWTKRTMYVPLDDPDYVSDPTQYNGTADSSLWYSNPTIEALLDAGYIVCGCENYGDALYGNNNNRNACVDFFYHMVNNWNVQDRCYMIGASNGAMTSLNAAYLLQGKVKAMILQYPITCLVNQYVHNPNHRADIRAAYGIVDADITEEELTNAVATHDPLTVDVVSGQKVGAFPPVKLYYSPQDTVVSSQYNSLALATMLENSNKVVETVQCSGEHGDHTHFAPADYVAWFNAN